MAQWDAIVIGAGIVGAACARALAADGLRVLVLDARYAANATTAAGMGHLVVMDDSPAQLALTTLSLALWRELAPTLPSAVEYDACGTIWVAADERELDAVHAKQRLYASARDRERGARPARPRDARAESATGARRWTARAGRRRGLPAARHDRGCWIRRARAAPPCESAARWTGSATTPCTVATTCSAPR